MLAQLIKPGVATLDPILVRFSAFVLLHEESRLRKNPARAASANVPVAAALRRCQNMAVNDLALVYWEGSSDYRGDEHGPEVLDLALQAGASMTRTSWLVRFAGRTPLWKVFWLYGVIPSSVLWSVAAWLMISGDMPGIVRGLLVGLLAYTAWIVVMVWHAAPNTTDARYGVLARALTVTWAINTVLMVFFLEL
ncbi:MAG: hypothetical protein ACTS5I_10280 [Rhodanobacter sp.]